MLMAPENKFGASNRKNNGNFQKIVFLEILIQMRQ